MATNLRHGDPLVGDIECGYTLIKSVIPLRP